MTEKRSKRTILASSAVAEDRAFGSVAPPIGLSTTFTWDDHREKPGYDYARRATPNRDQLTSCLAELEGAAGGAVTSSGLAALDLCLFMVSPGDLVVAPHDCYGGTHRLLTHRARRGQFELHFADLTDEAARRDAFARRPKLAYLETPSNPLMRITDLAACAKEARAAGTVTVADNTFLSPMLQSPLELGCDVVVHSTTKFIGGHSDVVGGAALAKDPGLAEELAWWANCTGVTGASYDSWLTLRGVRTLAVRVEAQQRTARNLARMLEDDERVRAVRYPGSVSHPQKNLIARQQKGPGSMISFELRDGLEVGGFLSGLKLVNLAESLGGFESLICVPDTMTHAGMEEAARREAGIAPGLLRLSVGLEEEEDLMSDLKHGLRQAEAMA
ncbi:PLP-dependent transferase [Parvularcula maris]|uniref:PLP-dependent transferase n=1 Tax=Parvularcula maris TaxID=2965077 RepID=A0A9X2LCK0_9PROT|nr:PLP-dependent transferase [Parvularcula maris]